MRGFFQNVGNEKSIRFPVYKEVKGYDIFLRFTTSQCTGQLLDITSRNNKQYLRITLLGVGPIRVAFNTRRGKGQLDIAMRSKGSFCDGKRHTFSLSLFRGAVYYNVDGSSYIRYYVSRLGVPFSSPDKIVLGKGVQGCITDSTVTVRASKTQEYVLQMSDECSVKSEWCSLHLLVLVKVIMIFPRIRVDPNLCFKARLGATLLIWKWLFIFRQIKFIFTRNVLHIASFCNKWLVKITWQNILGGSEMTTRTYMITRKRSERT